MRAGLHGVTVRAPGKVNTQLAVGGRRDDGYHDVSTVYLAVSLYDDITVRVADRPRLSVSGPAAAGVPVDGSNLAVRAARLLGERYGIEPNVDIRVVKRIPAAGGMAGGSADAAGVLVACNAVWGLGLTRDRLAELAAELGSDIPFSLLGGAALGTGRGERLAPLRAGCPFHFVFAVADAGLSTPAMFAELDAARERAGLAVTARDRGLPLAPYAGIEALAHGDATDLAATLHNDLEPLVTGLRPALAATREAGLRAGALAGVLCGSGATYAFLTATADDARRVADRLVASGTCVDARPARGPVPGPRCAPARSVARPRVEVPA